MKEEKIKISVNQEDVQNIINCYEKDIEHIKQLEEENKTLKKEIKLLKEKINGTQEERDYLFNKLSIENKSLQSQLKAKEEVIKEAREYVEEHRIKNPYHYEYNCFMGNARASDLLEILSKGENK